MLYLTYRWYGYQPEKAWDTVSMTDQTVKVDMKSRDGITYQPVKPGTTLADVNDYMLDNNQHILSLRRITGIGERNGGKILAVIGTEAERRQLPQTTDNRQRRA